MKASYEIAQTLKGTELRLIGDWSGSKAFDTQLEKAERVCLSVALGWKSKGDLSFLKELIGIRALRIECLTPLDLSSLAKLKTLEDLVLKLNPKLTYKFDFADVTSISSLKIEWNKGFTGLQRLPNLKSLAISELIGLGEFDFSGLSSLTSLKVSTGRSLRSISLNGVHNLKELTLVGLPKLERVEGFVSGGSVRYLCVRGLKTMSAAFWKAFSALEVVETTTKDSIEKSDFAVPPTSLLRLPL